MAGRPDGDRPLERMIAESEKLLGANDNRAPEDRIEILGRRIARCLAFGLALLCLYWIWSSVRR